MSCHDYHQCNTATTTILNYHDYPKLPRLLSVYLLDFPGESVQLPLPQRKVLEKSGLSHSHLKGFSKSHDNLAVKYNSYLDLTQPTGDEAGECVCVCVCGGFDQC